MPRRPKPKAESLEEATWAVEDAVNSASDTIVDQLGPDFVPWIHKPRYAAYGCGYFGCVMPTSRKGIVLKVTSDPHEAMAAAVFHETQTVRGIVKYHHVSYVSDRQVKMTVGKLRKVAAWSRAPSNAMFFLWREEAMSFGTVMRAHSETEHEMLVARQHARNLLENTTARERAQIWFDSDDMQLIHRMIRKDPYDHTEREANLADYRSYLQHLRRAGKRSKAIRPITDAMERWAQDMGLMLSDVHRDNVAKARRSGKLQPVITDPGVAILLTDGWDDIEIPRL